MASAKNGTLYIGVTNDIGRRAGEHREGLVPGFTKKHDVRKLVSFETFADVGLAIGRETRLKSGSPLENGVDREGESRLERSV